VEEVEKDVADGFSNLALRSARCFASEERSVAVDMRRDCEPRGVGAAVEEEAFSSFTDSTDTLGRFFWSLLPLLLAFHKEVSRIIQRDNCVRTDGKRVRLHSTMKSWRYVALIPFPRYER